MICFSDLGFDIVSRIVYSGEIAEMLPNGTSLLFAVHFKKYMSVFSQRSSIQTQRFEVNMVTSLLLYF